VEGDSPEELACKILNQLGLRAEIEQPPLFGIRQNKVHGDLDGATRARPCWVSNTLDIRDPASTPHHRPLSTPTAQAVLKRRSRPGNPGAARDATTRLRLSASRSAAPSCRRSKPWWNLIPNQRIPSRAARPARVPAPCMEHVSWQLGDHRSPHVLAVETRGCSRAQVGTLNLDGAIVGTRRPRAQRGPALRARAKTKKSLRTHRKPRRGCRSPKTPAASGSLKARKLASTLSGLVFARRDSAASSTIDLRQRSRTAAALKPGLQITFHDLEFFVRRSLQKNIHQDVAGSFYSIVIDMDLCSFARGRRRRVEERSILPRYAPKANARGTDPTSANYRSGAIPSISPSHSDLLHTCCSGSADATSHPPASVKTPAWNLPLLTIKEQLPPSTVLVERKVGFPERGMRSLRNDGIVEPRGLLAALAF